MKFCITNLAKYGGMMWKIKNKRVVRLILICFLINNLVAYSSENKGTELNDENYEKIEKSESMSILQEGELVYIRAKIRVKEEFLKGIVYNGRIYFEERKLFEVLEIELSDKEIKKNPTLIENQRYYDLEKEYKNLKINEYKFEEEEMSVDVDPSWQLSHEKERDINEKREKLEIIKKNLIVSEPEKEEWKMLTSGIMGVGYTNTSGERSGEAAYIRYNNNLFYGATSLNATVNKEDGKTDSTLDYLFWERDVLNNKKLLIGNTYKNSRYNTSDISSSITGVTLGLENSWDSQMRVTQRQISGYAPTGTVVELYENGILRDFQTITDGQYKFDVDLYNGSKYYSIKKYMSDGQVIMEDVSLLANESVLPKGKVDYTVDVGSIKGKESKGTVDAEIKYGIFEDFTGIIGGFDMYDEDYNKSSFYTVGEIGIIPLDIIGSQLYHTITYSSDDNENSMYKYALELALGKDQISYKSEDYSKLSSNYRSYTRKNDDLSYDLRVINGYNLKVGTSSQENDNREKERTYYGNLYKNYRYFYLTTGLNKRKNETTGESETYVTPGASYSVSKDNEISKYIDTISVYSSIGPQGSYGVNVGKNNAGKRGEWDYYLNYNNNDDNNKESFGLMVSYTPGGRAKITSNAQKSYSADKPLIQNSIETNVYMGPKKPKFDYAKNMGRGTVSGKIFLDKDGDGEFTPERDTVVKDSKVETYRNYTYADSDGEYTLGGLATYSPVELRIASEDDEMPYYISPSDKKKIKLNPGGKKIVDFGYRPIVSILSEVNFGKNFYREEVESVLENLEIEFKNMKREESFKYEFGKDDLIVHTVPVGIYSVELIYKGKANIKIQKSKYYLVIKDVEESEITFDIEKIDDENFMLSVKQDKSQLYTSIDQIYTSLERKKVVLLEK